ncbi:MAG: hypothetical protein WA137_10430 [Methanothrix sp.]
MLNKTILASPVTQGREAVKQLITYHNHGVEPAEMPDFYRLACDAVLVRSSKGDSYYVTTPKTCSCPSATYRPGQLCKHSKRYFPASMRATVTKGIIEGLRRLSGPTWNSIKPAAKWPGGLNGPVDILPGGKGVA